jgi:hypothetical protein
VDKPFHIFGMLFLFGKFRLPLFQLVFQSDLFRFVIARQFLKANIIEFSAYIMVMAPPLTDEDHFRA